MIYLLVLRKKTLVEADTGTLSLRDDLYDLGKMRIAITILIRRER